MSLNKTWGIVGLGWLGLALSNQLKKSGHDFWGTHRSSFTFGNDPFPTLDLKNKCDVLFLNTPPILKLSPNDFVQQISIEPKFKLIFISSTSVFGDNQSLCTENLIPKPQTESGQWLLSVEIELLKKFKDQLLVIRPGGLIGDKRHPVFYFPKDIENSGGMNPVNLIHRDDLIEIILQAEDLNLKGTLNAVAPEHPSRQEYYNKWADKLNLPEINFKNECTSSKQVESILLPQFYTNWKYPKLDEL